MNTFAEGEKIGKYSVIAFIKRGACAESYKVANEDGLPLFMKIYEMDLVPKSQLFEGKEVYEIRLIQELTESNFVVKYVDHGSLRHQGKCYHYLVTEFYEGCLLSDYIRDNGPLDAGTTGYIGMCVLNGLHWLHTNALVHNDIVADNILLHPTEEGVLEPTIIDLGHLSFMVMQRQSFYEDDLQHRFRAPETFKGRFTPLSDLFSVGALMYFCLFGKAPWDVDASMMSGNMLAIKIKLLKARTAPLSFDMDGVEVPEYMKVILSKALALKPEERYQSAQEFFIDLREKHMTAHPQPAEDDAEDDEKTPQDRNEIVIHKGSGNGLDTIAGREELKETLRREVLFSVQNPKKAALYKLEPIQGIVFYGVPGCGKTLVAQGLLEELGFNYSVIPAGDLGSVADPSVLNLLKAHLSVARSQKPFALCIDNIEELLPETNPAEPIPTPYLDFINLLCECMDEGMLFVTTSNQPEYISRALFARNCFSHVLHVTAPDSEARKDIFRKHLEGRPCESNINFDELARLSVDFVAGDITTSINEAATTAAYMSVPISQKILTDVLRYKQPSYVSKSKIGYRNFNS